MRNVRSALYAIPLFPALIYVLATQGCLNPVTADVTPPAKNPIIKAASVLAPQTCNGTSTGVVSQCLGCYDECTPSSVLITATPEDVITSSAFGRGTKCYAVPKGLGGFYGPAQIYSFLEDCVDTGSLKCSSVQPGSPPFTPGMKHDVHVRLWWKSLAYAGGGQGPRKKLQDTNATVTLHYQTADDTKTIELIGLPPSCQQVLAADTPLDASATVLSWFVTLPEDAKIVYVTALVPILENETFYADLDHTVRSYK